MKATAANQVVRESKSDRAPNASRSAPRPRLKHFLLCLLVVGGGAIAWGIYHRQKEDARAQRIARVIDSGELDTARIQIEAWVRERPDSARAWYLRARLGYLQNDLAICEESLERTRKLGHDPEAIERLNALALVKQKRYLEAEPTLVAIVQKLKGNDAEACEALARIFLETYRLELAAVLLEKWAELDTKSAKPYLWMTEIDLRNEQSGPPHAVEHYRKALERDPSLDEAKLGLAHALKRSNLLAEAAAAYRDYLEIHPKHAEALLGLARTELLEGRQADAIRHLDQALEADGDYLDAIQERAAIDLATGKAADALVRLDHALSIDPFHLEATFQRSRALELLGRKDEAKAAKAKSDRLREEHKRLRDIQHAFNRDPSNDSLRLEIARWMFEHGQGVQGVRWAKTVLDRQSNHREANLMLAEYYESRKETGLANYHRLQSTAGSSASPSSR
jgi:tetratricopeptide (TPR) repeat protein